MKPSERKEMIQRLTRRADHLEERILEAGDTKKGLHFDRAELHALRWAIEEIQQLRAVLEQQVSENDEIGAEFVLVQILRNRNKELEKLLKQAHSFILRHPMADDEMELWERNLKELVK